MAVDSLRGQAISLRALGVYLEDAYYVIPLDPEMD
jgi:hypothetical protein